MPKEVEELVFVWASRLSPYPWVRFDYPFPFVIRSKNRGELQCLLKQWMTVDDSLFLGTWTDKQSSIPYHDVCDAGLDFVGFFSLRSDMSAIWLW
ncbi:hypothetical protein TNCV_1302931 [Trichonephila clavipes]|nr:hypothetical protein TNCV_1302931 [Trichonephila clavipes]